MRRQPGDVVWRTQCLPRWTRNFCLATPRYVDIKNAALRNDIDMGGWRLLAGARFLTTSE